MKRLMRIAFSALVVLLLISLLAACTHAFDSRPAIRSNQPPAVAQPAKAAPMGRNLAQADPEADAIELSLTDLDNQLQSVDTLDDFR